MTEQEKILLFQNNRVIYTEYIELNKSNEKVFVNLVTNKIQRAGNRLYPKKMTTNIIYIQGNILRVKDSDLFVGLFEKIMQLFDIKWTQNLENFEKNYISKSPIFKAILTGRIFNEETLIKRIASNIYRVKDIEWKEIKRFLQSQQQSREYISLFDIKDFTKNFNNSIRVINRSYSNSYEKRVLLRDSLNNAVVLNRKIDLNWSERRLKEEHIKMVKEIMTLSAVNKSDKPIFPETIDAKNIKMLNTEKEIFCEGATMTHCVYTNYFNSVLNGRYLVFHMSSPEDCTIGVSKRNGDVRLDQAYKSNNIQCKDETIKLIKEFVSSNEEKISILLDNYCTEHSLLPDDLPF